MADGNGPRYKAPAVIKGVDPEASRALVATLRELETVLARDNTDVVDRRQKTSVRTQPNQILRASNGSAVLPHPAPARAQRCMVIVEQAPVRLSVENKGRINGELELVVNSVGALEAVSTGEAWWIVGNGVLLTAQASDLPAGATGPRGLPGESIRGEQGFMGLSGADGEDAVSIPGQKGDRGDQGLMGAPGRDAEDGEQGIPGLSIVGPQGIPGIGIPGSDGSDGDQGPPGISLPGTPGETGATGPAGIGVPGSDGLDGDTSFILLSGSGGGSTGATGATGADGAIGIGVPGSDGADGEPSFIPGPQGLQGIAGAFMPGADGLDGETIIIPGRDGATGATGSSGGGSSPVGIVLSATTHIIELATSTADTINYEVSYTDNTGVAGSSQGSIASAGAETTVQVAPGASAQFTIMGATFINVGTGFNTVHVQKDVSGTEFQLTADTILGPQERLEYTADMGWRVFDALGRERCCGTNDASALQGANFTAFQRADADADGTAALAVLPQFNWSADRVADSHEFLGSTARGIMGSMRPWGSAKIYKLTSEANHPGALRIVIPLGTSGGLCMGDLPNEQLWDPATLLGFRAILNLRTANPVSDYDVMVGFADDFTLAQNATVSAIGYATANSGGDKFLGITRAASTQTTVVPGSPTITVGNWFLLEAYLTGGVWEFFINGATKSTSSTNIPTPLMNFGLRIADDGGGTVDFVVDVDTLLPLTGTLGQRWT